MLRLLHLVQAPEYVLKTFKDNAVTGADLLHVQADDFDDARFRYPAPVRRKVLRLVDAWRSFHLMTGSMVAHTLSAEQFVRFHNPSG